MGVTTANFQTSGYTPLAKEMLKKVERGDEIEGARRLRTSLGRPSKPGDLLIFNLFMTVLTVDGEVWKESSEDRIAESSARDGTHHCGSSLGATVVKMHVGQVCNVPSIMSNTAVRSLH